MAEQSVPNLTSPKSAATDGGNKRKFIPNFKKALNKKLPDDDRPVKSTRKSDSSDRPRRGGRGGLQRGVGGSRSNGPQYVQSYSIFETGVGCVVKTERNAVELREARPSGSGAIPQTEVLEIDETEVRNDPMEQYESFISDIKQNFKDAPIMMGDSAAGFEPPVDPLKDLDLSAGRNHRVPYDFFTDSGPGRLFCLQLPDKILPSDLEEIKAGKFGKLQVLDNQQVRLVIGEATFELISARPSSTTSDVVLIEERGDQFVRLNCLGHVDQSMVAVPNLDEFVRIGQ